ncbi:hypothetical protein V2J09_022123 [Rumex salicifolius]
MKPENLLEVASEKCSLNCPVLDGFLAGGIPCNSITEIVAESGSGKTQLCLQLLLSSQRPRSLGGLSASSLYFHSEFPFPLRRLRQLDLSFSDAGDPLDRILVQPLYSADDLFDEMLKLQPRLVAWNSTHKWPIKLVVIDSIAALFRSEFENTPDDLMRRSSLFFKIAGKLKYLANKFGLAIVVTNHVTDVMEEEGARVGNLSCLISSGRRVCPALGLAWANCVNTRLFLSRTVQISAEERDFEDRNYQIRRHIHSGYVLHHSTLLDGEMIKDWAKALKQERRYLIYDLIAISNASVIEFCWD